MPIEWKWKPVALGVIRAGAVLVLAVTCFAGQARSQEAPKHEKLYVVIHVDSVPTDAKMLTGTNPGGNTSITVTAVAVEGPPLVTVITKVTSLPRMAGLGLPVMPTPSSALGGPTTLMVVTTLLELGSG